MSDAPEPGEALLDQIFTALDHGIASIDDGAGPLIPFLLSQKGDKGDIHRFVADRLEVGVEQARKAAAKACKAGASVAVAYDGFLTSDGKRMDAIFVQAADSPSGPTFYFAQRYRLLQGGKKVEPVGNAAYAHYEEKLFP